MPCYAPTHIMFTTWASDSSATCPSPSPPYMHRLSILLLILTPLIQNFKWPLLISFKADPPAVLDASSAGFEHSSGLCLVSRNRSAEEMSCHGNELPWIEVCLCSICWEHLTPQNVHKSVNGRGSTLPLQIVCLLHLIVSIFLSTLKRLAVELTEQLEGIKCFACGPRFDKFRSSEIEQQFLRSGNWKLFNLVCSLLHIASIFKDTMLTYCAFSQRSWNTKIKC